ncbi:MAG: FAD-binding oxidoreductase, partial [Proteobacteria bacterium]|nr:FAD-binding oxidoreductase [Pseudomonadota bacterium]
GNAGYLSIFEKSPFSYPGVFSDTARAIIKRRTPLVFNSGVDSTFWRWLYHFYQASKERKYRKTLAVLEHFGEEVFRFYSTLSSVDGVDCEYARDGLALIYTDAATYQKKLASIPNGSPNYQVLGPEEIAWNFPFVLTERVQGVIVLKRNGSVNPGRVVSGLIALLKARGVKFILNTPVLGFERRAQTVIAAKTPSGDLKADEFVIASGAEVLLARELGTRLLITPGRGYSMSFSLDAALKPRLPALFSDIYTALSPRRDSVRVTGKIEFGVSTASPEERAAHLVRVLQSYTKPFELQSVDVWSGNRPLTPDDMPYLGRDRCWRNVVYMTGLGHTGMNLGPVGARIISELIVRGEENHRSAELLLLSGFYQN